MPADGFNGPCVRDDAVPLDDPCADGQVKTVMKSRGYRKIAGDVCTSGLGADFEPYEFTCCVGGNVSPNGSMATTAGEGAATTNSRGNGATTTPTTTGGAGVSTTASRDSGMTTTTTGGAGVSTTDGKGNSVTATKRLSC